MPNNLYRALPLETLYELLTESIRNLLLTLESTNDYEIAFKPLENQIEMLLAAIEEKKKENVESA